MRSLSTIKNVVMSLLYEIMLIIFGMIMPRFIISTYGSEVNGLTSTINQVLSVLNLLQAGAVGASVFQMFKPVAEKDYYQISLIIESSKRYFRKIGLLFLILVMVLAPIISAYTESSFSLLDKILAFAILGINGSLYFFFISWFDILFSSHQERFVLSMAGMVEKIIYYGILFGIIGFKLHFVWMYVAVLVGTCTKILYLYWKYNKVFKSKMVKVVLDGSFRINNRGYLLCNQIATQSVDALPTILITTLQGLSAASVYAVYFLVQNMIKMVVSTVQLSVSEVFGNLVVSESAEKVQRVYGIMEFVFFLVAMVLCSCSAFLYMPFIYLYTGGNTFDVNYLFPILACEIVIYSLIYCMYMPCYTLTNVHGLYKQTYLQAAICAIIAIILAVGLGLLYWPLVLLGPVFYYVSAMIWRLYVSKKHIIWLRLHDFVRRMIVLIFVVIISMVVSTCIYNQGYPDSWFLWLAHACVFLGVVASITALYVLLFERETFKSLLVYGMNILKRKRNT